MCIIALCSDRALTDNELENCFDSNSDGAGLAWYTGSKLNFSKGFMEHEEFIKLYKRHSKSLPHVAHFRVSTSGGVKEELCHPFECSVTASLKLRGTASAPLLFHNGVYSNWEKFLFVTIMPALIEKGLPLPDGRWNDTRAIALGISLLGENFLRLMSGKFVLMDSKVKRILHFGDFDEEDGILFSNRGYKRYSRVSWKHGIGNDDGCTSYGHLTHGKHTKKKEKKEVEEAEVEDTTPIEEGKGIVENSKTTTLGKLGQLFSGGNGNNMVEISPEKEAEIRAVAEAIDNGDTSLLIAISDNTVLRSALVDRKMQLERQGVNLYAELDIMEKHGTGKKKKKRVKKAIVKNTIGITKVEDKILELAKRSIDLENELLTSELEDKFVNGGEGNYGNMYDDRE